MRTYVTAQEIGLRTAQCDATAVRTAPDGTRAYALLDGIGSSEDVRDWTRHAARTLARTCARQGSAAAGLRAVYEAYAAEPDREDPYTRQYLPSAAAIVAVTTPQNNRLQVAWCGDSRAYLLTGGIARRLTEDHNLRRVHPPTATSPYPGNRNVITSYLGTVRTDEEAHEKYGHPAIETTTIPITAPCRLVLASDGAYEPHEDAGHDLYAELDVEGLQAAARGFVALAVSTSVATSKADGYIPHADNATVLLADLTP